MTTHRGFTLIELGIVLAVVSVVAAYVVPDFIEMARNNLAQAAAKDMQQIQDSARWYLHDRGEEVGDAERARWPGELMTPKGTPPPAMGAPGSPCPSTGGGPMAELIADDYLGANDFTNPWGRPYDVSLEVSPTAPLHRDCQFVVATNVPDGVAGVIKTYMPDTRCDVFDGNAGLCPGNAPAGEDRCCARAVRPGYEASLLALAPLACDKLMGATWDEGIAGTNSGECNSQAGLLPGVGGFCFWANENSSCGDEYLIMGGKIYDCGKGCQGTQNYCCKADMF